jgi:hypothetical protein
MNKTFKDVFSSGQIGSKIWMCEELEKTGWESNLTQIYGGWWGLSAFLLLSRGIYKVKQIQSFDIDPNCETIADLINENWVWQNWKFKAYTEDCNKLNVTLGDVIINTSTEHFSSKKWFDRLPYGTNVVLQGNNMKHDEEDTVITETLADFTSLYPLSEINFKGQKIFEYPDWKFTRFMIIGTK